MKLILSIVLSVSILSTITAQEYKIYVSDAANFNVPPWKIMEYDQNGLNSRVFISDNLGWPQDILFKEDEGVVLISNLTTGTIGKHDATTGNFIEFFATGIQGPTRMKIGPDSLLYILEWAQAGRVQRYSLDGDFIDEFNQVGVTNSIGLDWDADNNLYISSWSGAFVRRFDPQGNDLGIFIDSDLQGPTNIWFDSNGDLNVLDYSAGLLKKFDSSGQYLGVVISGLNTPEDVDFLPNGDMLIGDGGTGSVKQFDSQNNFVRNIVAPGAGGLIRPNAVVVRNTSVTSSNEQQLHDSAQAVFPTIGRLFYLDDKFVDLANSYKVYNSVGSLVHENEIEGPVLWDANKFPAGNYTIVIRNDQESLTQQVLVVD